MTRRSRCERRPTSGPRPAAPSVSVPIPRRFVSSTGRAARPSVDPGRGRRFRARGAAGSGPRGTLHRRGSDALLALPFHVGSGHRQIHVRYSYSDRIDSDPQVAAATRSISGCSIRAGPGRGARGSGAGAAATSSSSVGEDWATPPYAPARSSPGRGTCCSGRTRLGRADATGRWRSGSIRGCRRPSATSSARESPGGHRCRRRAPAGCGATSIAIRATPMAIRGRRDAPRRNGGRPRFPRCHGPQQRCPPRGLRPWRPWPPDRHPRHRGHDVPRTLERLGHRPLVGIPDAGRAGRRGGNGGGRGSGRVRERQPSEAVRSAMGIRHGRDPIDARDGGLERAVGPAQLVRSWVVGGSAPPRSAAGRDRRQRHARSAISRP